MRKIRSTDVTPQDKTKVRFMASKTIDPHKARALLHWMTMVTDPQSSPVTMTVPHSTITAIMVLLSRMHPASRLTNQMYLAMRLLVRIHQATCPSYQANPPMPLLPHTQNQITH